MLVAKNNFLSIHFLCVETFCFKSRKFIDAKFRQDCFSRTANLFAYLHWIGENVEQKSCVALMVTLCAREAVVRGGKISIPKKIGSISNFAAFAWFLRLLCALALFLAGLLSSKLSSENAHTNPLRITLVHWGYAIHAHFHSGGLCYYTVKLNQLPKPVLGFILHWTCRNVVWAGRHKVSVHARQRHLTARCRENVTWSFRVT